MWHLHAEILYIYVDIIIDDKTDYFESQFVINKQRIEVSEHAISPKFTSLHAQVLVKNCLTFQSACVHKLGYQRKKKAEKSGSLKRTKC